jgi:hypothetical protein
MSYPWIKDSQYVTPPATGYLAVTSPNGLYLTDGVSNTTITPTSVTSTTFNGNLNGSVSNATNATNVDITDDNTNATFYPVFVSNNTGNLPLKVDKTTGPLSYNPSTGILVCPTFSPGNGNSIFSALTTAGLEVLSATTGRTKILNNQITCATTATGIPPTTTINPTSITCSNFGATSTTTITPTSVTSTTFTGALSGNATTATTATTATNIAGGAAGRISYQTGSGTTSFVAVGNGGQFLQANGPSAPTWVTQNGTATVTLLNNSTGTTTFPSSGTATLTVNFASSYSCVTRFPVTLRNSNGTITISVNTYTLSGGLAGGQYTIVLEITMDGNAGTTLNFNGTGIATGAKYNFTSISNSFGGSTVTKYVVLTFAYDGTNYYLSGSNFS